MVEHSHYVVVQDIQIVVHILSAVDTSVAENSQVVVEYIPMAEDRPLAAELDKQRQL